MQDAWEWQVPVDYVSVPPSRGTARQGAADRAIIGSSFMDFSRRNECRLLGLQRSCERAARTQISSSLPGIDVACHAERVDHLPLAGQGLAADCSLIESGSVGQSCIR